MSVTPSQQLDETLHREASPAIVIQKRFSRSLFFACIAFLLVAGVAIGLTFLNMFVSSQIEKTKVENTSLSADIAALKSNHAIQGSRIVTRSASGIDMLIAQNNPMAIDTLLSQLEIDYGVRKKGFSYNDGRVTTIITADNVGAAEGDALNRVIAFIAAFRESQSAMNPLSPTVATGSLLGPKNGVLKLQPIASVSGNSSSRSFAVEFLTR